MKEIKRKLNILENIWRNRFWDYDYLLKNIGYQKSTQSNYPGIVFGYLSDTIPIIENYYKSEAMDKNDCFLATIGLLQTIYIQQDLIDELLQVFKLQESKLEDKNPNRTIRNDLAGHPIRRRKSIGEKSKSLQSYSLFSYEATKSKIQYLNYRKETNFTFELKKYDVLEVISQHKRFLEKYLDKIFREAFKLLRKFSNFNQELLDIQNKIDFIKLLDQVEIRFNNLFRQDNLFDKRYLEECWTERTKHPRYQYAVDKFNRDLLTMITDVKNSIENLEEEWHKLRDCREEQEAVSDLDNNSNRIIDSPIVDRYELSKLYDDHPIFGIKFFMDKFSDNAAVLEELKNMKENLGKTEFYCSYNYLSEVLLKNHIS